MFSKIESLRPLKRILPAVAAIVAVVSSSAFAADFKVDPVHSTVGFSVKHMVISSVNGKFNDFSGEFTFDAETGKLGNNKFEVKTASIDTGNQKRDDHLRSADFFDAAKFPLITITNSKITKNGKQKYQWLGDLTMHGVTKPVKFDLEYMGSVKGFEGETHAGFKAVTQIKRSEWGLKWNKALEAGGMTVGDEVNLDVQVEATAK